MGIDRVALEHALMQAVRLDSFDRHRCSLSMVMDEVATRDTVASPVELSILASRITGAIPMTRRISSLMTKSLSRRDLIRTGAVAIGSIAASSWSLPVRAAPVNIRYATGGGIGPNEM